MPAVVYHYTDGPGLRGIVGTRSLWLTDSVYLNDAQEMVFARAEFVLLLDQLIEHGAHGQDEFDELIVEAAESAKHELEKAPGDEATRMYVACFSENRDQLSQWRAYGGQRGGYCLAVKTQEIFSLRLDFPHTSVSLDRVRYGGSDDARSLMYRSIERLVERSKAGFPGAQGWTSYVTDIVHTLASVKHPAFSEESEWRYMASAEAPALQFRDSALGLTPYIIGQLDGNALAEVLIGPGPHQELRRVAVQQLLGSCGLEHVVVSTSDAPLRV